MFEPYNLVTPPETNLPESQLPILQYNLPKLQYDLPSLNFPETLFEESQNNQTSTKPIIEQKFNNHKSFVETFRPLVEKELINQGIDLKFSDKVIAHIALESNWGKRPSGKNNFAGLKGKGTAVRTHEYYNGVKQYITDSFKDFNSLEDFTKYYINRLKNKFKAFESNNFVENIKKHNYFTAPLSKYGALFNMILKKVKQL